MLGTDEMRAWYGPDHVCLAADRGAIGTLLISDNLFRYSSGFLPIKHKADGSIDLVTPQQGKDTCLSLKLSNRKVAMLLYFQVCMNLGNVSNMPLISTLLLIVFSELNQLTGIAAILTFPLDVEVVEAEEREEAEARKRQEEEKENDL